MRKRYALLAATCGAPLAVALALLLTREREPRYEGKELSYWVRLWGLSPSDSVSRGQAQEAIVALGTNNFDLLVSRISFEPSKDTLLRFAWSLPLGPARKVLLRPVGNRFLIKSRLARDAVEAFYAMGPAGAPAAPLLAKTINSGGESAMNALKALEAIGEAAFPTIGSMITNATTPTPIRMQVINHLKHHTDSPIARDALTNALHNTDPRVRLLVTEILGRAAFE